MKIIKHIKETWILYLIIILFTGAIALGILEAYLKIASMWKWVMG